MIKFLQLPNITATKIFSHQPCDDQKNLGTNVVATKCFSIAPLYGDQNILITTKVELVICFKKTFDKTYAIVPFLGD
jgi:hypothetical protein